MKRTKVVVLVIVAMAWLVSGLAMAADGQKLQWTGVNYTKFLWGNGRYDGSMYNFTTIPGEGGGDNGQATEFELLFNSKPSSKVEVNGRIKSRFNQNHWTNFGGFGGYPGSDFGGTVAGDGGEWDPRSNEYIKLRGITVTITPGYSWLQRATIGSNDFGMFDPFTIGKIRYIDRDNGKGFVFQGSVTDDMTYDLTRMSLPRLWSGPAYNTGDYTPQDAAYGLQLKYGGLEKADLAYIFSYVSDVELDVDDLDADDGLDLTMRQRNHVHGLKANVDVSDMADLNLQGYYSRYYTHDGLVGMNSGIGTYSAYPVGHLDDFSFTADLNLDDPFDNGLSMNMQYFHIGADFVSVMAARREADVLLTEGHEGAWFFPQVENGAWGSDRGLMGYGGFLGHAQQVATANVDNEFVDFDEPMAETVVGWKGFTFVPSWGSGNLDLAGEVSYIDYDNNWQMWGNDDYTWDLHPYPTAEPDAGMLSVRNAYMPFQEKTTYIFMLKGEYFLDGPEIELHARVKYLDEEDLRINDEFYLPFNEDGTVNNAETAGHFSNGGGWKQFDDLEDDDKQMEMYVLEFGLGKQLTDELFADLTWVHYDVSLVDGNSAFQAWNAHTMSGGEHVRNDFILSANYIVGGVEFGGTMQFALGEYAPDYGDGYTVEYRDDEPGFTGRWGRWNSLAKREFDHRRMKAYMKLNF